LTARDDYRVAVAGVQHLDVRAVEPGQQVDGEHIGRRTGRDHRAVLDEQ
jgi:hypothetical protein